MLPDVLDSALHRSNPRIAIDRISSLYPSPLVPFVLAGLTLLWLGLRRPTLFCGFCQHISMHRNDRRPRHAFMMISSSVILSSSSILVHTQRCQEDVCWWEGVEDEAILCVAVVTLNFTWTVSDEQFSTIDGSKTSVPR